MRHLCCTLSYLYFIPLVTNKCKSLDFCEGSKDPDQIWYRDSLQPEIGHSLLFVQNAQFLSDKLFGRLVRFSCGHSTCENCANNTRECFFCISSPSSYVIDNPQTTRLNNAAVLLSKFQDTFKVDVNKRKRISDHLKVEKLVFPECIQAPQKYGNKQKTLNNSSNSKENIGPNIFPGEEIKQSDMAMKKTVQYVQNWLNQIESKPQNCPRKPFGDINVNTQTSVHQKSRQDVLKLKNVSVQLNTKQSTYRKRHFKFTPKTSSFSHNVGKPNPQIKNMQTQLEIKKEKCLRNDNKQIDFKCDNNESGIVIDDEPIVIEDTERNYGDKDKQAWLAVLEAADKDECEGKEANTLPNQREANDITFNENKIIDSTLGSNEYSSKKTHLTIQKNVLFFKKSSLFETCKLCHNNYNARVSSRSEDDKSNDVSIVINNSNFITTIKFMQCGQNNKTITDKNSIAVQTDTATTIFENEMIGFNDNINSQKRKNIVNNGSVPTKVQKNNDISRSLDVFGTDKNSKPDSSNSFKRRKCLILEDSDTDSNISCDNTHEVIVDVHRPSVPESVECGILKTLSQNEYRQKSKRQIRGHTPNSSNSSDKENLDPNRRNVLRVGKKHKTKK